MCSGHLSIEVGNKTCEELFFGDILRVPYFMTPLSLFCFLYHLSFAPGLST